MVLSQNLRLPRLLCLLGCCCGGIIGIRSCDRCVQCGAMTSNPHSPIPYSSSGIDQFPHGASLRASRVSARTLARCSSKAAAVASLSCSHSALAEASCFERCSACAASADARQSSTRASAASRRSSPVFAGWAGSGERSAADAVGLQARPIRSLTHGGCREQLLPPPLHWYRLAGAGAAGAWQSPSLPSPVVLRPIKPAPHGTASRAAASDWEGVIGGWV